MVNKMFKKVIWKEGKQRLLSGKVKVVHENYAKKTKTISYESRFYPQRKWFIFWLNYTTEIELLPIISYDVIFFTEKDAMAYLNRRKN